MSHVIKKLFKNTAFNVYKSNKKFSLYSLTLIFCMLIILFLINFLPVHSIIYYNLLASFDYVI
jgi:hypothetical protein